MKLRNALIPCLLLTLLSPTAQAKLNVFACEPEWAALVTELGADEVTVHTATTALQDPHHIQARPSLIAKVRRADLVVCSGAELETGWLPMLLRQARNPHVQPGQPGYFEAAAAVKRLEVPQAVDRAMGDVHAEGNPHVHLDPRRIALIAKALVERMATLDTEHAASYRKQHEIFAQRWQQSLRRWESDAAPLKGVRAVVHHKDWVYLFDWLGIVEAGTLEPKPGLPTSIGHLSELKQQLAHAPASMLLHTPYQSDRAAKKLSGMTGLPIVTLPYTVGGNKEASDLFALFDDTIKRLLGAHQ